MQKALRTLCELLDSGREEEYSDSKLFCLEGDRVTRDILDISWFSGRGEREKTALFAPQVILDKKPCYIT